MSGMQDAVMFSARLRTYRKRMGWTQDELARRWGYSIETISAWERNRRLPATAEIPRLAQLLEIDAELLAQGIALSRAWSEAVEEASQPDDNVGVGVSLDGNMDGDARAGRWRVWGADAGRELVHAFANRTEFSRQMPYAELFAGARSIAGVGISLNALALNYSRDLLIASLLRGETSYRLSFLAPSGHYTAEREREEGIASGQIAALTRMNLRNMRYIREQVEKVDPSCAERLRIYVYDLPARFNTFVIDDAMMVLQIYAYDRGEDTPVFMLRRAGAGGLFDYYHAAVEHVFAHATLLTCTDSECIGGLIDAEVER